MALSLSVTTLLVASSGLWGVRLTSSCDWEGMNTHVSSNKPSFHPIARRCTPSLSVLLISTIAAHSPHGPAPVAVPQVEIAAVLEAQPQGHAAQAAEQPAPPNQPQVPAAEAVISPAPAQQNEAVTRARLTWIRYVSRVVHPYNAFQLVNPFFASCSLFRRCGEVHQILWRVFTQSFIFARYRFDQHDGPERRECTCTSHLELYYAIVVSELWNTICVGNPSGNPWRPRGRSSGLPHWPRKFGIFGPVVRKRHIRAACDKAMVDIRELCARYNGSLGCILVHTFIFGGETEQQEVKGILAETLSTAASKRGLSAIMPEE